MIWGGGSKAVGFLTHFHNIDVIEHVVDINPHMIGNYVPGIGIEYKSPDILIAYQPDVVIVMNGVYKDEIEKMLISIGIFPELLYLK